MRKIYAIFVCVFLIATVFGASVSVLAPKPDKPQGGGGKDTPPADPEIVFVNEYDIYVMNADGSNKASIYTSTVYPQSPSWSGDGTKITFSENGDIFVMDVAVEDGKPEGSNLVRITNNYPNGNGYHDIAWSPVDDNKWVSRVRDTGIYLITKGGNSVTEELIYSVPAGHTIGLNIVSQLVTWSNDGDEIAFCEAKIEYLTNPPRTHFLGWIKILDLTVESTDPGYVTTVLTNDGSDGNFILTGINWAKTKDTISFSNSFYTSLGPNGLYTLDLTTSGSTPEYVTKGGGASWSPDDSKIVYISPGKSNTNSITVLEFSTEDTDELVKRIEPWGVDWSRA
jgi:Tol biopolymer transport system component